MGRKDEAFLQFTIDPQRGHQQTIPTAKTVQKQRHCVDVAFMKERVVKFKTKVVNFRSCKNLDEQVFRDHLASAPWHVAEVSVSC